MSAALLTIGVDAGATRSRARLHVGSARSTRRPERPAQIRSHDAVAVRRARERPRWERHSSVAEAVRAQPMVQCALQFFGVSKCSRRSA
jgi:hypothetical protein